MSMIDQDNRINRTVTAFFDTRESAEKASRDLVNAGVSHDAIMIVEGKEPEGFESTTKVHEEKGFWESLKYLFLPEEDRYVYAEGLRRGGYLLTVRTETESYDRILDILDREGTVDMNERETTWRAEGWKGYGADELGSETLTSETITSKPAVLATPAAIVLPTRAAQSTTSVSSTDSLKRDRAAVETLKGNQDEVIPVMEEQIQVGKRDVSHGKVRLRSYVVETPVSEQVNLRNESVEVNRRPVDRAVTRDDVTFKDRVIEAEEYAEEAVVSKTARVIEEVSLRKVADSKTETVSDTVRATKVEVDDNRGHKLSAVSGTSSADIVPHMDVFASDGQKIGTVDHLEGEDKIKLAKTTSPDGLHHFIPLAWVDHVDQHVHLNKPKIQVQSGW